MIVGIGTDIVEVKRIQRACEKDNFLSFVYTESEIEMFHKRSSTCATNFAVKEAVAKMLGTGFRGIKPIEIEVLRESSGKPYVKLYENAKRISQQLEIDHIFVTISDTKEYAIAYVIGESCKF